MKYLFFTTLLAVALSTCSFAQNAPIFPKGEEAKPPIRLVKSGSTS